MNALCKHMSFGIVLLSLFANTNTHGMFIKLPKKQSHLQFFKRTHRAVPPKNTAIIKSDELLVQVTLKAVKDLLNHHDFRVRYQAYDLLNILVEKNYGLQFAIEATQKEISSSPEYIQTLLLLKTLVKKDLAIEIATKSAADAITNNDFLIRQAGIDLFIILLNKNCSIEIAAKAAICAIANNDNYVRKTGIDLLNTLISKNYALETATHAAAKLLLNDPREGDAAIEIYKKLFTKGHGFESALATANTGFFLQDNPGIKRSALKLLYVLVKNNYGHEIAIKAATINYNKESTYDDGPARSLFAELKCQILNIKDNEIKK